jgi:nitrite reductase/ring-hydroxylating ferredoxin subunit
VARFVRVAQARDVVPGRPRLVEVEGRQLAVFLLDGAYFALDNVCSHLGGPLCEGEIEGELVQCPWHASSFEIKTGRPVGEPATKPVETFKVRVVGEHLEVEV